jgi:hypothetical protein
MILGNICTRSCNFCAIQTGRPTELDLGEPARVADAVQKMGLATASSPPSPATTEGRRRQRLGRHHPRHQATRIRTAPSRCSCRISRATSTRWTPSSTPSPTSSTTTSRPSSACSARCACRPATTAAAACSATPRAAASPPRPASCSASARRLTRSSRRLRDIASRQDRHPHHRPVPAAHAAALEDRPLGAAGGVRPLEGIRLASASASWSPARSSAPATTPTSSRKNTPASST